MPFHDLNITYTTNHASLSNTLAFHAELGFNVVALSIDVSGKLPSPLPSIPLQDLSTPSSTTALTRLTLTISDTAQNHRISELQKHYNLLALRPTNEKALQLCCSTLECDIISLDFKERLPFILKFKTIAAATQRGVRFEICYSPGIAGGSDARRNLISGAASLIRATRGRGIILSSEARGALGVRGPWDVINLAQIWGLGQERGKEALCEEAGKVVKLARLKRTSYRGVVDVIDSGAEVHAGSSREAKGYDVSTRTTSKEPLAGRDEAAMSEAPSFKPTNPGAAESSTVVKRKASAANLNGSHNKSSAGEKSVSKRELKRQAKKARIEARAGPSATESAPKANGFTIKHESLSSKKKT